MKAGPPHGRTACAGVSDVWRIRPPRIVRWPLARVRTTTRDRQVARLPDGSWMLAGNHGQTFHGCLRRVWRAPGWITLRLVADSPVRAGQPHRLPRPPGDVERPFRPIRAGAGVVDGARHGVRSCRTFRPPRCVHVTVWRSGLEEAAWRRLCVWVAREQVLGPDANGEGSDHGRR